MTLSTGLLETGIAVPLAYHGWFVVFFLLLGLLIWKFFSIIAQIRIVDVENFGLIAGGRRRTSDGFR
jgi:hypothetical protein